MQTEKKKWWQGAEDPPFLVAALKSVARKRLAKPKVNGEKKDQRKL
jgi:hypothetical protein